MSATASVPGVAIAAFLVAVLVVAYVRDLAWVFSIALGASIFAQWPGFALPPLPVSVDRIVLLIAFAALVLRKRTGIAMFAHTRAHRLLLLTTGFVLLSAAWAETLTDRDSMFRLLDAYGLVPFAMFVVAPHVFGTEAQRRVLLRTLTLIGAYLCVTAVAETLGVDALVYPKYILDPAIGLHPERARGPFVEAVANGLALMICGVAAAVVASTSPTRRWGAPAAVVALLTPIALFLTLTRSIWLGSLLATAGPLLLSPRLRRYGVAAAAVALLVGVTLVSTVPELGARVTQRQGDQSPIWDRINLNDAAGRMIEEKPLVGFGWNRFITDSEPYLRQSDEIPLSGLDVELHNVFLARLVELGFVGGLLWGAAFTVAVLLPLLSRPSTLPPAWRIGLAAIATQWIVVANLTPLLYVFPNLMLWTWAGLVYHDHVGARRTRGMPAPTVGGGQAVEAHAR